MREFDLVTAHTIVTVLVIMGLDVEAQDAQKNPEPLKGKAEIRVLPRVARPLPNAKSDFAIVPKLQSRSSGLDLKGESLFSRNEFFNTGPKPGSFFATSKPEEHANPFKTGTSDHESKPEDPVTPAPTQSQGTSSQPEDSASKSRQIMPRRMVIRLKRYRSLSEMEVVWEAARTGSRWLKKGADVTILLDMDAVHAANKSETANAWYEQNRGNGNVSSDNNKISSPQDQLNAFVQSGGKLVISERWAKIGGMGPSGLICGTQLLSDDAIDDLLINPDCAVISY